MIDEVYTVRPARVCLFGGVAKLVEYGRKLDPQFANASACHQCALFLSPGAGKDDLVLDIALHLPHVAGMSFRDVHNNESDLALVLIIKLVQGGNLPPEGWSSVASENHHYRLSFVQLGQVDGPTLVEFRECEIRSGIAHLNRAGACPSPKRLERRH